MRIPRRYLTFSALVVVSSSVFSFGGVAHAETPQKQMIHAQTQVVEHKSTELQNTHQSLDQLMGKKATLAQQIEDEKKTIADLTQKIADKKSAAEEATQAEARAALVVKRAPVYTTPSVKTRSYSYSGNSSGNLYDAGYCTWYVKNRRPDLPNNLGNANSWYYTAASMGLEVGSTPRAGAVGTTTRGSLGHVVYVESVNGDGTITVSEMNYAGLYSQRTRTADASEFLYIY